MTEPNVHFIVFADAQVELCWINRQGQVLRVDRVGYEKASADGRQRRVISDHADHRLYTTSYEAARDYLLNIIDAQLQRIEQLEKRESTEKPSNG